MKHPFAALIAAAVAAVLGLDAVAASDAAPIRNARSVYTDTHGPACRDVVADAEFGLVECTGPGGRVFEISDAILQARMRFSQVDDHEMRFEPAFRPSGDGFGRNVEWRLTPQNRPFATIYRAFTYEHENSQRARQVLVVTKLDGPRACHVAYVDAHTRDANERAREAADTLAPGFRCGLDSPRRIGNTAWY